MASSATSDLDERFATEHVADPPPIPEAADDSGSARGGSRLLRVALSLLRVHAQIARQELARDQGRILWGVVLMMVGSLLVATVIVLLQVLGVALLQAHGLRFSLAVLIMAGADAGLGWLLLVLGKRTLRQPVLVETRALVRRTLGTLISP